MKVAQSAGQPMSWIGPERRPLVTLLSTTFLSMISNQMTNLAVPWFVLVLTGSAARMGITAAATMLPSVVMMFIGGAIADRMRPKSLSILSDALSGITVGLVPLLFATGHLTFTWLLILMVAGALFDAPGYSARSKILPQLADRAGIEIEKVTSAQGMMQAVSILFGTILAGSLIGILGAVGVLWFNAAAFALSALAMLLIIPDLYVKRVDASSIVEDIREGMRYVWNHQFLRTLTFAALVINALTVPIPAVLIPYMAKMEWDSAFWFGVVMSGFGAGALIGSLLAGALANRVGRAAIFRPALLLFALPSFVLAAVPGPYLGWVAVFGIGLGSGLINPIVQALLYRMTDHQILGRVMGVISAGALIASPAGILIATPLLETVGLGMSFFIFAVIMLIVAISLIFSPMMKMIDSLGIEEPVTKASMD